MTTNYISKFLDWVSALTNSNLEKKAKGWMAMRGSWGRKKRSGIRFQNLTPIHHSLSLHDSSAKAINYGPYLQSLEDKLAKKSIPKINDDDINAFAEYFNLLSSTDGRY